MPGTSRSNQSSRLGDPSLAPENDGLSGQSLWKLLKKDLPVRVAKELEQDKKWNSIVRTAKQIAGDDLSVDLLDKTFAAVGSMSLSLIRAIDTQKAWSDLVAVVNRTTKDEHLYFTQFGGLELTLEMLKAVHVEAPNQSAEKKLLGILSTYDGHPEYLRSFMNVVSDAGDRNIFSIARRCKLSDPKPGDKPTFTKEPAGETASIGVTGGPLLDFVLLVNPTNDRNKVMYGNQAAIKIMQAFYPEKYSQVERDKRTQARQNISNEYLRDLSISDLLADPEKAEGSRLLVRTLEVFKSLQQHIAEMRGEISRSDLSAAVANFHTAMSEAGSYSGGTMMGWFKDHKDDPNVPIEIRDAYRLLNHPLLELDAKTRIAKTNELTNYYIENVAVISAASIQPIVEDAYIYRDLQRDDKNKLARLGVAQDVVINERLGRIEERYGNIESLIDKECRKALRYDDVAYITAQLAIAMQLRRAMNRELLEKYQDSISKAIELARKYFQDKFEIDGATSYRWRVDSIKGSVPDRIAEEHIEAAKVGVNLRGSQQKKDSCLDRADLKILLDLLRLETLAPSTENKIQSTSISRFRELIVHSAAIERRVTDFYQNSGIPFKVGGYTKDEIAARVKSKPKDLPKLLANRDYHPKEELDVALLGMSLDELVNKVSTIVKERRVLKYDRHFSEFDKIQREASAGLFLKAPKPDLAEKELLLLRDTVRNFTPATEIKADIEYIKKLAESKFCGQLASAPIDLRDPNFPSWKYEFLAISEVKAIKELAALQQVIEREKLPLARAAELLPKLREWGRRTVITAPFGAEAKKTRVDSLGQITKAAQISYSPTGPVCTLTKGDPFGRYIASVYDADAMEAELKRRDENYVQVGTLPQSFFDRVREVRKTRQIINAKGTGITWLLFTEADLLDEILTSKGKDLWISRAAVDSLQRALIAAPRLKDGILVPRGLELKNGEPVVAFENARKGQSLFSNELELKFVSWISRTFSKPAAREIASEVYRLRVSGVADYKEQFARWIGEKYPNLVADTK